MASRQPNIILIITDQQRYDTVNALGYPYMDTPVLDRMVAAGRDRKAPDEKLVGDYSAAIRCIHSVKGAARIGQRVRGGVEAPARGRRKVDAVPSMRAVRGDAELA